MIVQLSLELKQKYNNFLQTNKIITFLVQGLEMKKTLTKLIIEIESKTKLAKRSSKTISTYINKVPINKDQANTPSSAYKYVQEQMSQYPLYKRNKVSRKQQMLSEKIKLELNRNRKVFNELVSKLQQKLTFLQLEQLRQIIQKMGNNQLQENKTTFKKINSTVNYFLQSSTQKINNEKHIIQSAEALLNEIRQAQKKKVNQIY